MQTDRRTLVKQYAPDLSMRRHKNYVYKLINDFFSSLNIAQSNLWLIHNMLNKQNETLNSKEYIQILRGGELS